MNVEALTEPAPGGGERLRLRAHVQTNLASVLKPALAALGTRTLKALPAPARQAASPGTAAMQPLLQPLLHPLARQAGQWLGEQARQRAAALAPRLSRWAAPVLAQDLNTWIELHASTAPLVEGARALLPNAGQLARLGIHPDTGPNAPPVQGWQGRIGNEAAQVSLLRIDDRQLPDSLKASLGGKPFQLAAAVVNVASRKG